MAFDAHDRGFTFFKGACTRGVYDNMKTAVETVFRARSASSTVRTRYAAIIWKPTPGFVSGGRRGRSRTRWAMIRERFFTTKSAGQEPRRLNGGSSTAAWQ